MRTILAAQTISVSGSQISVLALPTLAVLFLGAGPLAAAVLFALTYGAEALTAPLAGLLVDTIRRHRRLLVAVDLAQAATVATAPLAYALGVLSLPLICGVAAISGCLTGITDITISSIIPRAVPAEQVVRTNAAVTGARTAAQITGPGLAGWLIQLLGAATAMLLDALSYLASAVVVRRLSLLELENPPMRPSLRHGVAALRAHPMLVRIALATAALNLGGAAIGALYVVYALRQLGLPVALLGFALTVHNAAAVLAVATVTRVTRRIGLPRLIRITAPLAAGALLFIPAAAVLPTIPTLLIYGILFGYSGTLYSIGAASLQQTQVATDMVARVTALSSTIGLVAVPVGALTAGLLAAVWGTAPTMTAFALLTLTGTVLLTAGVRYAAPG
jgi:predicted MFS family arabinose efflux permease